MIAMAAEIDGLCHFGKMSAKYFSSGRIRLLRSGDALSAGHAQTRSSSVASMMTPDIAVFERE
jgi:hypothetical protein